MAVRALIIAIENYPQVTQGGMAKHLEGTLKAGLDFKAWLEEKWAEEDRDVPEDKRPVRPVIFCSEPVQPGCSGATSKDIRKALLKLKQDGQSATEELYVFFSGHGFSFVEKPGSRADVVISSDFEQAELSPDCCLNLDEMVHWLRLHLGPGRHYYFIDSCRNPLTAKQIQIAALLPVNPQASGEASTFMLQSTVEGAVAAVGGPFPGALLAGLRGRGKAKTWDANVTDAMIVRYDTLRGYLKRAAAADQQITSRTAGTDGESDAVLSVLRPIPISKCRIEIKNGPAPFTGKILYRRGRSKVDERHDFSSDSVVLSMEPDDYTVAVQLDGDILLKPPGPVPIELYDDQTLVFERVPDNLESAARGGQELPTGAPPLEEAASAEMDIVVPQATALKLQNVFTGEETLIDKSGRARMPAGRYFATLGSTRTDRVLVRKEIEVAPGEAVSLNLADWRHSAPHVAIAGKLPDYAVQSDGLYFSESLGGPIADPDLDLWLAIVGGGRILGSTGDYSKLAQFPLHDFAGEQPGASPIYVLAGFEDVGTTLQVGLSQGPQVEWSAATQPADMTGIREAYIPAAQGSSLLSFRIGERPAYTIATLASPNRGMLVTLTSDDEGNPRISQYLLPLGHLVDALAPQVSAQVRGRNHLKDVRFIAQASRAFRKRRDLVREFRSDEMMELLYAKWLDPIGSSLAAYEALRRGKKSEMRGVVANMKRFFNDIPDTAALAKLAGEDIDRPNGVPLFFDGLRAFPNHAEWLPLPAGLLDFSSPWTAWRAAVNDQ